MHDLDIAIIGAGFAGLNLAHAVAGHGLRIAVVDKQTACPDIFRAEKIEPAQAELMREHGTLNMRSPRCKPVGKTLSFDGSRLVECDTVEQYGISYADTVNSMRAKLPPDVPVIHAAASEIRPGDRSAILLDSGETIRAKLVVIATGDANQLCKSLGMRRVTKSGLTSLSFGFYIARQDGSDFEFNGFNYFLADNPDKIHYLTIFPIGARMRVNLFTRLSPRSGIVPRLRTNTVETIGELFPNLLAYTGAFELDSQVQVVSTAYYRLRNHHVPGVIVIGDAFQSVSPATGSGLSKVLTDVSVLSNLYRGKWKNMQAVGVEEVKAFYRHQTKAVCDRQSLKSWYYSDFGPNSTRSLLGRLQRRLDFSLQFPASTQT